MPEADVHAGEVVVGVLELNNIRELVVREAILTVRGRQLVLPPRGPAPYTGYLDVITAGISSLLNFTMTSWLSQM